DGEVVLGRDVGLGQCGRGAERQQQDPIAERFEQARGPDPPPGVTDRERAGGDGVMRVMCVMTHVALLTFPAAGVGWCPSRLSPPYAPPPRKRARPRRPPRA